MPKTGNLRRALLLSAVLPWLALSTLRRRRRKPAAPPDPAQPAMLVADQVFHHALTGHADCRGQRRSIPGQYPADAPVKITFDQTTGTLQIDGPIRIDQDGDITILANAAEMDSDLRNGLLTGARMVFQEQLQLASLQMTRVSGRYTQLYKTADNLMPRLRRRPPAAVADPGGAGHPRPAGTPALFRKRPAAGAGCARLLFSGHPPA